MSFDFRDFKNGIYAFDAGYVRPLLAAIHMVVEKGRVALIDTGSNDSLANTLDALAQVGLGPEAVDFLVLTHIHLDHAGGAGLMMRNFPNARLVVHPRGARHMAAPEKLVAGVSAVYGEDYVRQVYGDILPIDPARIVEAPEGFVFYLAGREFKCLDTPGHARHHNCIVDTATKGIFTGDMFGLSYRELDVGNRQFIFPTTSPTQFHPDEMRHSVSRLLELQPSCLYLTHYSQVTDVDGLGKALLRRLNRTVDIAESVSNGPNRHSRMRAAMNQFIIEEVRAFGCQLPETELLEIWETDLELNTQGLEFWLDNRAPTLGAEV